MVGRTKIKCGFAGAIKTQQRKCSIYDADINGGRREAESGCNARRPGRKSAAIVQNARIAFAGENNLDCEFGVQPDAAHALGFADVQWLADKLGVSVESETAIVEPLGVVRTPFVVFNGWKITVQEQREGSKTKYLLYAVKDGQEQRELANASTHAFNWIKKHCVGADE